MLRSLQMLLAAALVAACVGEPGPGEGMGSPTGPPDGPSLPIDPVPPAGEPAGAQVLTNGEGSLVISDRLVLVGPGQTRTASLEVVAHAPGAWDVLVVLPDTTAAALRARPVQYHRGGLQPADETAILDGADQVLASTFVFAAAGSYCCWALPIEGKAVGKGLVHVYLQPAAGGERAPGQIEFRVE